MRRAKIGTKFSQSVQPSATKCHNETMLPRRGDTSQTTFADNFKHQNGCTIILKVFESTSNHTQVTRYSRKAFLTDVGNL